MGVSREKYAKGENAPFRWESTILHCQVKRLTKIKKNHWDDTKVSMCMPYRLIMKKNECVVYANSPKSVDLKRLLEHYVMEIMTDVCLMIRVYYGPNDREPSGLCWWRKWTANMWIVEKSLIRLLSSNALNLAWTPEVCWALTPNHPQRKRHCLFSL